MANYRICHTTKYAYSEAVAISQNLIHLTPRSDERQQRTSYRLLVSPEPSDLLHSVDAFGNDVDYFSIQSAHRGLTLSAVSEVTVAETPAVDGGPPWEEVRDALPGVDSGRLIRPYQYAFPSKLATPATELAEYARQSFTPDRPIVEALIDFTHRIHGDFTYDPKATHVATPVMEAFQRRVGVCQDFAHVAIACLRSLRLAAGYVSGYLRTTPPPGKPRLVGADASHAWFSLFCGEQGWIDADPTNDMLLSSDHVTVAHGRDYADVCPIQGVYVGGGAHTLSVSVDVAPQDAA